MKDSIFHSIVVGVDGTEAGREACRQAARIAAPGAAIEAVAVAHLADAVWTGADAPRVTEQLTREAQAALEEAAAILGDRASTRFINGQVPSSLVEEVERTGATLVVLGSRGHRRLTEMLLGGVAGEVLHAAPCCVLIARPPAQPDAFPHAIVCGHDGSAQAEWALAAARMLADRFHASLRVVTALRGKQVAPPSFAEQVPRHPVEALVDASRNADLVIVGSRGLHGLRALGSVSERVAHQAACSVLVVRPAAEP